jgi:plasmid rolling circle replication initiator protein Rep
MGNLDEKKPSQTDQSKEGINGLPRKLDKYYKYSTTSLRMSNYIEIWIDVSKNEQRLTHQEKMNILKIAKKLDKCGAWLVFNHYYTIDELRLAGADFCKKHLLCPFCASRRGIKSIQAYAPKVEKVMIENPRLKMYMVTYTIKNGDDLKERFYHLKNCLKFQTDQKNRYFSNPDKYPFTEFCKAKGGVYSIEVKKGKNSKQWHPHVHMIWMCEVAPDPQKLSDEWKAVTGDSHNVDVREMSNGESQMDGFMEVFKYALKFSKMSLEDNFEAYLFLNGKRLCNPFGCLRGIKVDEDLTDDLLEGLPYMELFYNYKRNSGYDLVKTKKWDL